MARISFSPLIVSASGKVQDTVFSRWKGQPYIRSRVTPANPKSADQTTQRNIMSAAVGFWQKMHATLTAAWNTYASGYGISGYNACTKRNAKTAVPSGDGTYARLQDACSNVLELGPANSAVPVPVGFNAQQAVGAPYGIDILWTYGSYVSGDLLYVVCLQDDAADGILVPPEFVIEEVAAHTTGATSIAGLDPTHTYSVFGMIYDLSADAHGITDVVKDVTPKLT